jgi:hypothetical protein
MPTDQLSDSPWRSIRTVLLINAAIAVGITSLSLTVGRWNGWDWFRDLVLSNLVYANVMGGLAALVIPPVAIFTAMWRPVRRWAAYLSALLAVGLAGPMAASAALVLFGFAGPHSIWTIYQRSVGSALLLVIVIGLLAYWLERLRYQAEATSRALRAKEAERELAEKLAAEARLSSLESRLQPHFLFNTINSILALIREDPPGAEAMLERLAASSASPSIPSSVASSRSTRSSASSRTTSKSSAPASATASTSTSTATPPPPRPKSPPTPSKPSSKTQ